MTKAIEKKSKNINKLDYTGTLNIKLMDDDRILESRICHNAGCTKLFTFLATCLAGDYNSVKSTRPCRVILFREDPDHPTYIDNKFNLESLNENCRVSTKVFYDSTPEVYYPTAEGGASITYHFRIPFLCLTGGEQAAKVALYPNTISNPSVDVCAYYVLETPISIPERGGNFTIIIDWTLAIANK